MNLLGNIIWIIFGGLFAFFAYVFGGILLCCTVVGVPWGLQLFKLAPAVLAPFGKRIVSAPSAGGCLALFCNIVWILCGGLGLAIGHIVLGILFFITIIGIPFARQHFKLVEVSLMPFGKRVV
ncbi:YccF domain-containing protein [Flaviaesturariibacter flavus]|uniref:YccF domain-containing protein n=1 Tax=Flaviaesturariibacter flavus TaxID=2502780 RepID=A0A4R1BMH7_9BACT|nr:YccF domain-containing protein [Flaviaesturariibacter flavus]TCJ18634.1 YccF domain-containing protein [Flaviaesturariibacter flavus]